MLRDVINEWPHCVSPKQDPDAEEDEAGPGDEAPDLMEPENDFEDFWANPSNKDTLKKKRMEIRSVRKAHSGNKHKSSTIRIQTKEPWCNG